MQHLYFENINDDGGMYVVDNTQKQEKVRIGMCELTMVQNIAVMELNNGRYNKLCRPDFCDLDSLKVWLKKHHARGLVITGAGKNFCAGADLETMASKLGDKEAMRESLTRGKQFLDYIEQLPIITVAAISGCCYGGGLEIALSCMYRIACTGTFFSFPESKLGILPGLGGTYRLKNVIGKSQAVKMILTGDIIDVEEAKSLGLIDLVVDKKTHIQKSIEFIEQMNLGNDFEEHIEDVIKTINSDSQDMETEMFLKYVEQVKFEGM